MSCNLLNKIAAQSKNLQKAKYTALAKFFLCKNILTLDGDGAEMIEALPPPPMFCSVCENDSTGKITSNCCSDGVKDGGIIQKSAAKARFISSENSFSTLPNIKSRSFSSKKSKKESCQAGIQVQ